MEAIWAESADRHLDDSVDSQSTLVEQELERDRVHAEAMEQDRREAERLRLQAQFDAMQLNAMESAMGKAKEDAMRQNVPISWKSDIVFSSEDERVTVAAEAIDVVGCTGFDFYVGATRSPLFRWTGGATTRGYMDGHCESWSEMRVIGIAPPGQGGSLERALIKHAKTYSYQCHNKADDNRGMSPEHHCFIYVVVGYI